MLTIHKNSSLQSSIALKSPRQKLHSKGTACEVCKGHLEHTTRTYNRKQNTLHACLL